MPIAPIAENDAWAAEMADAQASVGAGIIHDIENGAWVADSVQPEGMVETEVAPGLSSRFQHGTIKGKPMADLSDKFLNESRPFVSTSDGVIEMGAVFAGHRGQPFSLCYVSKNTFSFIGGEFEYLQNGTRVKVVVPDRLFTVSPNTSTAFGYAVNITWVREPGEESETNQYPVITGWNLVERTLGVATGTAVTQNVAGRGISDWTTLPPPKPGDPVIIDQAIFFLIGESFIPIAVVMTESSDVFWQVSGVTAPVFFITEQGGLSWW